MRVVADDDPRALVPRSRPPATPRWLWILALVAGAAGVIAFVVAALRGGDASSGGSAPASTGSSFPSGLVLGAGIGLAIGWVLGRRAGQSSAQSSIHSERSKP